MVNGDALDWQHRIDIACIRRALGPCTSRNDADQSWSRRGQDRSQNRRLRGEKRLIWPDWAGHSCCLRTRRRTTRRNIARKEPETKHQNITPPHSRCAFLRPRNRRKIGIQIGHIQSISYRLETAMN